VKATLGTDGKLIMKVSRREKDLLFTVLRLYPRVPPGYQKLSKKSCCKDQESSERLLEEALAEQRSSVRSKLEKLLKGEKNVQAGEGGYRMSLSVPETEWLLQVLNDIRVGSWVSLGEPDHNKIALNEKTAPDIWAMEVSGMFQMGILEALEGTIT
jgi:hypothetical protein